jgi:site-specific DNA-methyltransferase (adenine-specific)
MAKKNLLYYGDNLDILRRKVATEVVDLCYIDPPFNSKRNYNQIYNNIGKEDRAQAQAFIDTWVWDDHAIAGYDEIISNADGRFQPTLVALVKGLHSILKEGSLLAYLISMAQRLTEIHRVLKRTGTFYLHCDPTASHYLKLLLDAVFLVTGGDFRNEIIWCYAGGGIPKSDFPRKHDVILRYTKGNECTFNPVYRPYSLGTVQRGRTQVKGKYFAEGLRKEGTPINDWWTDVPKITSPTDPEKLGYPTQKPEALLDRIITISSNENDVILDAYCGCGTTVAVAQKLKRKWIGIDITYQSISLVLRRLEKAFGAAALDNIKTDGIPSDMRSAEALAHMKDDRLRKEFEKWAVLTYTNNRAVINERKGADAGIDARAYFKTGKNDNAEIIFQVKSGGVKRGDIATLRGDMAREKAELAYLVTLEEPSAPMVREAKAAGQYQHAEMGRSYDRISIVTVKEIIEDGQRLEIPMSLEVLAAAQRASDSEQIDLM